MRDDLERLLRDTTLTTLALAIAVGWSLYEVAHGASVLVEGLATHLPRNEGAFGSFGVGIPGYGMTWPIGHRILSLDALVIGLIELAVVLAAATFVRRVGTRSEAA